MGGLTIDPVHPTHATAVGLASRHRLGTLGLAGLTVAVGLGVRTLWDGMAANLVGVALWDTLVGLLVVLLLPRVSPGRLFVVATLIGIGTELFQATGVPMMLFRIHPLFGLVLGTTFEWADVAAYPLGGALVACGHALRGPPRRSSAS